MIKKILLILVCVLFTFNVYALSPKEVKKWDIIESYGKVQVARGIMVDVFGVKSPCALDEPHVAIIQVTPKGLLLSYAYLENDVLLVKGWHPKKDEYVLQPCPKRFAEILKRELESLCKTPI
jgi:hypothetical protein